MTEERMLDRSRLSHKWIAEEFYKAHDVYAFRSAMFVEWGFRSADVKRTTERIKVPGAVVKEWARTAHRKRNMPVKLRWLDTRRARRSCIAVPLSTMDPPAVRFIRTATASTNSTAR